MKNILITTILILMCHFLIAQNSLTNNDINFKEVLYNSSFMTEDTNVINLSLTSSLSDNIQQTGRIHFMGYGIWHKFGLAVGVKLNSRFQDFHKSTSAEFLMGKQIKFGKDHNLNFGLNFGLLFNGINKKLLNEHVDLSDDFFTKQENQIIFQGGFGLSYIWKEALKIGFSMPELAKTGSDFYPTLFANVSYKHKFSNKLYLEPAVLAYYTDVAPFNIEGSAKFGYKDFAWLKVGGRSTKSLILAAGGSYDFISVGYAYNMNFGTYENLNQMQHNINIGFKFLNANDVRKKNNIYKAEKKAERKERKIKSKENREQIKEIVKTAFRRAKLSGSKLALYYIILESVKDREQAFSIQKEMQKTGQNSFIMKDMKTEEYYISIDSGNSKKDIIEKLKTLRETVAPNAWIIVNL